MPEDERTRRRLELLLKPVLGHVPNRWPYTLRRELAQLAAERRLEPDRLLDDVQRGADPEALQRLVAAATVSHTRFFRHESHFERLEQELRARHERGSATKIWSAGCATGEEAYSVALVAERAGARVTVLATDVSAAALDVARRGHYPRPPDAAGPAGPEDGNWTVSESLRAVVRFERRSLTDGEPEGGLGPFDYIFCRNVFIYFEAAETKHLIAKLAGHVRGSGAVILAPVEALLASVPGWRHGHPLGWLERAEARPAGPPPQTPPTPAAPPSTLDRCARALGLGALDEAERELRAFLQQQSKSTEGWFLLGEVLERRGELTQAAIAFTEVTRCGSSQEQDVTLARAARRRASALRQRAGTSSE